LLLVWKSLKLASTTEKNPTDLADHWLRYLVLILGYPVYENTYMFD
jgi:hypothetical protein